jgi:hypothetical protein
MREGRVLERVLWATLAVLAVVGVGTLFSSEGNAARLLPDRAEADTAPLPRGERPEQVEDSRARIRRVIERFNSMRVASRDPEDRAQYVPLRYEPELAAGAAAHARYLAAHPDEWTLAAGSSRARIPPRVLAGGRASGDDAR